MSLKVCPLVLQVCLCFSSLHEFTVSTTQEPGTTQLPTSSSHVFQRIIECVQLPGRLFKETKAAFHSILVDSVSVISPLSEFQAFKWTQR